MSDLYSARATVHARALSLDEAIARVEPWGVSVNGARKVLGAMEAPYAEATFVVRVDHPDADPLHDLTHGFLHLLLVDLLPGLEARAHAELAKQYRTGRCRGCEGCGVVFWSSEATAKELTLRVVCAASDLPDDDVLLVSTAWCPDRERRVEEPFEVAIERYPAPGLAGAFSTKAGGLVRSVDRVLNSIRKTLRVGGVAAIGASGYAVSREDGHVVKLEGKKSPKVGKARPADKKRVARGLHAVGKVLFIEWEDGGWTSVEPKTGARTDEDEPSVPEVVSRDVVIDGITHRGEATPDPDTWLVWVGENAGFWHVPSGCMTCSLGPVEGVAWKAGATPKLWWYHEAWVGTLAFNLS